MMPWCWVCMGRAREGVGGVTDCRPGWCSYRPCSVAPRRSAPVQRRGLGRRRRRRSDEKGRQTHKRLPTPTTWRAPTGYGTRLAGCYTWAGGEGLPSLSIPAGFAAERPPSGIIESKRIRPRFTVIDLFQNLSFASVIPTRRRWRLHRRGLTGLNAGWKARSRRKMCVVYPPCVPAETLWRCTFLPSRARQGQRRVPNPRCPATPSPRSAPGAQAIIAAGHPHGMSMGPGSCVKVERLYTGRVNDDAAESTTVSCGCCVEG